MEKTTSEDSEYINGLILEYLDWAGLEGAAEHFASSCKERGILISQDGAKTNYSQEVESFGTELLAQFDAGQGAKFFKIWKDLKDGFKSQKRDYPEEGAPTRSSSLDHPSASASDLDTLTLEFYLHIYFATLPLRHGHDQDHTIAMKVFGQFLKACPSNVGSVQELLPFYALPYIPDPVSHPTFAQIFKDEWVRDLRLRLSTWVAKRQNVSLPTIFTHLRKLRQHSSSVGATLLAQESAASAVRGQRTLRRRLQSLNEDYQKLIGVSWELTQALEAAVRGERVDLEATLAACTHRYPELFSLTLTADTSAGPASILLESMQRCERRPGGANAHLPALDFERVRTDLGTAPETHVLLLLQALRHRITRVTSGSTRNAVITSYARNDVLGARGRCRSWQRIAKALTNPHHQLLAQTAARLINALTAFNAGRSYLATEEASTMLLKALNVEQPDPACTDMVLAALQKLSIRDEVQTALIRDGCVEWLANTLGKTRTLPPYTQEYAAALLMNLTLRTAGRARCVPLAPMLLPALTQLLATVPSH
ncbi:LisH domain-containing protein armc9, partial [Halocaridina rubra]